MKFSKPNRGLDFLTGVWLFYCVMIFWSIPSYHPTLFGLMLISGLVASIGIWLNIRLAGYLFAFANIAAAVLAAMLLAGYFLPDRPFKWRSILTVAVPLYCAYAAIRWSMDPADVRLENAKS